MNSKLRQLWFITRPERDPAFHEDALKALASVTNNFQLKWSSNRELHKKYEQALIDMKIKRNSISADGSGGRTWAALLKTFAYCYTNKDGLLIPTKVALEILNGNNVFENIKKQALTLQIPNSYFLEKGFKPKFDDDFAILPVRFLVKLCLDKRLDFYLTKEEITFIVMSAKLENELESITHKILEFRNMSLEEQCIFKSSIANKYDHRDRSDNEARDFYSAHSDVAHTFMLIAEYTQLVEYERGAHSRLFIKPYNTSEVTSELKFYDNRYPFNTRYLFSLERMAEVNGLDINSYKASRYGSIKPASNLSKKLNKAQKLLSNYPNVSALSNSKIASILSESSFSMSDANKIAEHISTSSVMQNIDEKFVQAILNESDNLEFENKVGRILREFGFEVIMHPKINNELTEIDILLKYRNNLCGIIDAKNYKDKFTLSASLSSHMISEYIPNYTLYEDHHLNFFGYITCNNIGGVTNLMKICTKSPTKNLKGIMINVKTLLALLDYFIENDIEMDNRVTLFLKLIDNTSYTSFGQVLRKL